MEFKNIENEYWDSFYKNTSNEFNSDRDFSYHHRFKDPFFVLPQNSKVLELACGVRCDGIELARKGILVYETDISGVAVQKARQIYEKLNLRGEFIKCDAENLPFVENYFDGSFISASFHHLPDPLRCLKEMKRVTKSGEFIVLGLEPNSWPYFTVFWLLKPLKKIIRRKNKKILSSIADDNTFGFTKKQLKKLCAEAGLEIVSIKREKYLTEFYDSGLRFISKILNKTLSPNRKFSVFLEQLDYIISHIPVLNLLNWHWSVICRKL
jgi:ubiquinone/menaquinone biosynthesis C-methylase UbiE